MSLPSTLQSARIAVLMTCHNRCELTLRCLESLRNQAHFSPDALFLVDDGSIDGSGDAVRAALPGARVIAGDGSLFWNGGMRLAWDVAIAEGGHFDFYLWLNDDVVLDDGAFAMLVEEADQCVARGGPIILCAATCDVVGEEATYGGQRISSSGGPLRMHLVSPTGAVEAIDTVSGNIVLISASAQRRLGNLRVEFEHIFGDLDYGLRARAAGIPVMQTSRFGGRCAPNSVAGSSLDSSLGKFQRLALRWREDRRIHARDWRRMVRFHVPNPFARWLYVVGPYLRILLDRPHPNTPSS